MGIPVSGRLLQAIQRAQQLAHRARWGPHFRMGSYIYDLRHWSKRKRSLKIYLMYLHNMHAGDSENRRCVTFFITGANVSA